MTTSTLATTNTEILADFAGGSSDVAMMIGVGIVKDSDAVFFQYLGDKQSQALMMPQSGRPLTRLGPVTLHGIDIAYDIGEFNSTKLNLFLESSAGNVVMVTAGLTTIWSQCVITGLMSMIKNGQITAPFALDSWKGNSKMRPCFAAIRMGKQKVSDSETYDALSQARGERNQDLIKRLMVDCVDVIRATIGIEDAEVTDVTTTEGDLF